MLFLLNNKLIFSKRRYNCVILCGCEEKVSLRKFVLLHQEFLPKKYEKVEKLIKKIESLSGVYNDKALSESKTLKLYNPWLMTIITMPLAYILRVLKILVCLIVLLYFFKIVDFFFDANIVKEAAIYISKINNLDLCVYFILFYIFVKTLFSLVNATRFYNYNNVSLLLWNKNIEHSFKKAFLCISTLRIKELDFSNETPEEAEEANKIFCPDCGYVYYDENNKWLKKKNEEYEILLKKTREVYDAK